VIFTGNGYSSEWPIEAAQRGLPNLNTTPLAIEAFKGEKCKKALTLMKVFSEEECDAVAESMYENYNSTLNIEAETMVAMVATGFTPAFAKDLAIYKDAPALAGDRARLYSEVLVEAEKLKGLMKNVPNGLALESKYLCDMVKPQMAVLREKADAAEQLMETSLYPYPTYQTMVYDHHF